MRLPIPVLLTLLALALAVLIGLGVWQIQRNEWKQGLVAESSARTDAPPLEVGLAAAIPPPDDLDFRRVVVTGEWLTDDVMFIANRVRVSTRGEEIVVPVRFEAGRTVLVNMGWIPDGMRDQVLPEVLARAGAPVEGLALDVTGRTSRRADSGSWTALAPESMAEALGYEVEPWIVLAGTERTDDVVMGEALPVQGWTRFHSTTPHLEYAVTWFGIAAALVAIAVARFVLGPWQRRTPDGAGRAGGARSA